MELEFLDGGEPPKEEVAPEAPAAEAPAAEVPEQSEPEEKPERPRGPDGKFAKKEVEEPVMVPLKALHETRDEVKALKAELDRLRVPQQPQQQAPDIFEDPEGFQNHLSSQMNMAVLNATLNLSEELTTQSVGAETVEQAKQWATTAFQSNPALYQSFISQRNPYGFLVSEYQRQQMLSQIGEDPKEIQAYLAWKQAQQAQPAETPSPQPVVRPTGSIASAPSAGGMQHQAVGPGVAFDEIFRK
jgi:hypothetical protein